ncbi:2,3-bisphosphoglycerate-dependent phosphoglycerate mutase [Rhodoferax sediminis]|uniref:2,3-bisphosphoglycerate-dependent phosphoglycerate mutase n=1 Tax=Rhodoferax sediminis TaxID=2509614 RepID=A0A515DE71_9BURK|nr:2,3-bisphosphoglycerate-dependent phosphoglycerate mutase [Rhodoferax sediminis]
MTNLVLLRHGESEWNREGRFAGWVDVALTATGIEQARRAGITLRDRLFDFDLCYTSVLRRATHTAWHCLDAMDRTWLPTIRSWRLNERHYGALHGLNKAATANAYGEEQVRLWRRSYDTRPPALSAAGTRSFTADRRYADMHVPASESVEDTVARVLPFLEQFIRPSVSSGTRALVVAHGTSLRAMIKILCGLTPSEIVRTEISNGVPLVVELDKWGKARRSYSLDG